MKMTTTEDCPQCGSKAPLREDGSCVDCRCTPATRAALNGEAQREAVMTTFTDHMGMETNVGDVIDLMGLSHRIVRIKPYSHPSFPGQKWAQAFAVDGWGITLEGE